MRRRPVLTILMLIFAMILTLPARAQQKNVGPSSAGPRPNAVRPYVACAAAMPALPPQAQQKPFTQEQVSNMVRAGFGDESGAKLIEQRGIDFAPSEDFYQTLKAAGASEAFLKGIARWWSTATGRDESKACKTACAKITQRISAAIMPGQNRRLAQIANLRQLASGGPAAEPEH